MKMRGFTIADALMARSPGQEGEIFAGDVVDEKDGGPISIGYGRYSPNETLTETMAVDDVMIVLEGELTVSTEATAVTARPGGIVHMPKGETVTIRSGPQGALTAYVTCPHWRTARG